MSIFSKIFNKDNESSELKKRNQVQETDNDEITAVIATAVAAMEEEEETVAAITAAIACMLGKNIGEFTVKNIRKTSEIDSLWALKGRMELMR